MIPPQKSLGQNFLQDENIARNIVESLALDPNDRVIEIGPGHGALTKHLLGRCKKLIGIEVDPRAIEALNDLFGDQLTLINRDVLTVDLHEFVDGNHKPRIVGNIPYYITSEILFWMFDQRDAVEDATLMMQWEVARRLVALPRTKEYGILSVVSQFYSDTKIFFKVSPQSFFPKPDVESAVVHCVIKKEIPAVNERLFRTVVRGTFGKRRKTLKNGLRYLGCSEEALSSIPFDLGKRPEELTPLQFVELTRSLEAYEANLKVTF